MNRIKILTLVLAAVAATFAALPARAALTCQQRCETFLEHCHSDPEICGEQYDSCIADCS